MLNMVVTFARPTRMNWTPIAVMSSPKMRVEISMTFSPNALPMGTAESMMTSHTTEASKTAMASPSQSYTVFAWFEYTP